jgi:serine/threonine-protein kinase
MPATAAESIGSYVLERELGRGAHGVVYRAHHADRPGVPVALKVVAGRGNLDRLLVEPAVLARLDHPGIVGLEDYFVRGDDLVLALEFVEGEDLHTLLERGETFTQAEVRDLLVQLGGALAEAHARGVVHRDVKPSNVLVVRRDGQVRFVLTGFGIGQVAEGIQVRKHTGGTFLYMAPEQLRGRPCPQSDLWALGVVAYRLLTGRLPFDGGSLAELSNRILYAAPVPPGQCSPAPLDPDLEGAVVRLLDKSLEERTPSAEDLLRQLGHRAGEAGAAGRRRAPPGEPGLSLDRKLARGIARHRRWIIACVLLYLLPGGVLKGGLGLAGMLLFYRAQTGARRPQAATAGALALLAAVLLTGYLAPRADLSVDRVPFWIADISGGPLVPAVIVLVFRLLVIFVPVIGGDHYARMRRLERERVLREAAQEEGADSDRYLEALRESVDRRFEDVGLHLKYAEALFARGRVRDAAVEASLLLRQDAYHFNGNLLLANAYLALGLVEDCAAVCDRYLAVSGYCFEFGELREQCRRRLGRP